MRLFKKKEKLKVTGKNNINNLKKLAGNISGAGNTIQIGELKGKNGVYFNIEGNNNNIKIGKVYTEGVISIAVKGNNNEIILGDEIKITDGLTIQIIEDCENGRIFVGDKTTFWNSLIQTCDNNSSVEIGEDCMFSYNTKIFNSDGHSVIQDGRLINKSYKTKIGNHVWVGYEAVILKNSLIQNNSIAGYRALVSGKFNEEGLVLTGIPAKIVKKNINWSRLTPNQYEKEPNGDLNA